MSAPNPLHPNSRFSAISRPPVPLPRPTNEAAETNDSFFAAAQELYSFRWWRDASTGERILGGLTALLAAPGTAALGLFSGLSGCENRRSTPAGGSRPIPLAPTVEIRRQTRVDLDGQVGQGEIRFLRQIHQIPNLNEQEVAGVARLQFEILRELEGLYQNSGLRHIFIEGQDEDFVPTPQFRSAVAGLFPQGIPSPAQLNIRQAGLLYRYGVGAVFVTLHPDVTGHRVSDPDEGDAYRSEYGRLVSEAVQRHMNDTQITAYARPADEMMEDALVNQVQRVYRGHPALRAQTIAVIYGQAHGICDNFTRRNLYPSIQTVWWELPSLTRLQPIAQLMPGSCSR